MKLHDELAAAIDAGVHGHLVTLNADGSPQVTMIWVGRDGDELQVAHLGAGQKLRNIERDPRVALSIVVPGSNPIGLDNYAVHPWHGDDHRRWRAASCCNGLAYRFLGDGREVPADGRSASRSNHPHRHRAVTGSGPWVS